MKAEMILTCGSHARVRLVERLNTIEPGTEQAIYQLPGGRYVVGYTDRENGMLYQDPDATPADFAWEDEETADSQA